MQKNKWICLSAYCIIIAEIGLDYIIKPDFMWRYTGLVLFAVVLLLIYGHRRAWSGTLYDSHGRYILKTVWVILIGSVVLIFSSIAWILLGIYTGISALYSIIWPVLIVFYALVLWAFYRSIKGLVYLLKEKTVTSGWF
ncbi:hypothetical protein [Neisseria sp.]|uniref:hypothetical protein n=1 Tax=Neisseria sp. TaxID=192066 RepID=UPI0026DD0C6C|nr:hypothetical protein [Neisseria sp.]MDO4227418.1 hypothetical protein [Neisseria sp.]